MVAGITLGMLIGRAIGAIIGFTLHEWGHAWAAVRLGDNTPLYQPAPQMALFGNRLILGGQGRLTLDPRAHIDPIGFILVLIIGFGWAHPVPVNPRAFYPNEQRGLLLVSLAGPVMNLFLAFVFGVILRLVLEIGLFSATSFFAEILIHIVLLNIVLCFFNLVPFYPLDGWKILLGMLPYEQSYKLRQYERESMFALMLILMLGVLNPNFNLIWVILGPIVRLVFDIVTGVAFF